MKWLKRAPKRWRLAIGLAGYLVGLIVGGLTLWPVNDFVLAGGIFLIGIFCLIRHFGVATSLLVIGAMAIGFWWSRSSSVSLSLDQPARYVGKVEVVQSVLRDPPKTHIQLKLLESDHAGQLIEGSHYDWATPLGTRLNIETEINPNKYRSAIGRNVVGQIKSLEILGTIAPPGPIYRLRELLIDRVGSTIPEPHASLAIGLLTGVNADFDSHFKDDLRRTGTTHIVAVSGANLTIVALLLMRVSKRWGRWWAFFTALGAVVVYTILSGFNPSILRGLVMATLALLAATLGRITHRVPLLLLTAALLSIQFPLGIVYSLSWQLSFLAFAGILFLGAPISRYFKKLGLLGLLLGETLAAELMVVPLILATFGQISVIGPLVNLVVLLFVPLAMAFSFGQAIVALVSVSLGRIAAWVTYPVLTLVVEPIAWSSRLPFASYVVPDRPVGLVVGLYFVVAVIAYWLLYHHELEA